MEKKGSTITFGAEDRVRNKGHEMTRRQVGSDIRRKKKFNSENYLILEQTVLGDGPFAFTGFIFLTEPGWPPVGDSSGLIHRAGD